jgi:hypothetical protein
VNLGVCERSRLFMNVSKYKVMMVTRRENIGDIHIT